MPTYTAPTKDMAFILHDVLKVDQSDIPGYSELDPDFTNLTMARRLQRFALATLYYATNGDEWTDAHGWMQYDVHECEWFATGGFGYEFFPSPQAMVERLEVFFAQTVDCLLCAIH